MNLGELVGWGIKTLAILDSPGPDVLRHGTVERLEEKLGWLRQFREGLTRWSQMEQTIDVAVDFVRTQGLYRGAGKDLRKRLRKLPLGETAKQLGEDLATFVTEQAAPPASWRATAWQQRGARIVLRQVQDAGARAEQGWIHQPALGTCRVRFGANSRGRPQSSPDLQNC